MFQNFLPLIAIASHAKNPWLTGTDIRILLFIVDREAPHLFDGPHFQWEPSPFGPTARALFLVLDELSDEGFITIRRLGRRPYGTCRLTDRGQTIADKIMMGLEASTAEWLRRTCLWVTSIDTLQLLEDEMPAKYPEMVVRTAKTVIGN